MSENCVKMDQLLMEVLLRQISSRKWQIGFCLSIPEASTGRPDPSENPCDN